ncbi:MAG: VOC family protein [Acidimicrobiia bacterium]
MASNQFPSGDEALTHILVVGDPAASKEWYGNVLGAEIYREYGSSVVVSFNGAWILLVEGGEPTPDKPGVELAPPDGAAMSHSFTVRVDDCHAAYEVLKERGAAFLSPPYDWGAEIRCFFPDPDGHLWEISEAVS